MDPRIIVSADCSFIPRKNKRRTDILHRSRLLEVWQLRYFSAREDSSLLLTFTPQRTSIYASNPAFKGVVPIPQDDGPYPLAQIAYSEHYSEAMGYLRALMVGDGEMSQRALEVTGDIIAMNPAHYTVWYNLPFNVGMKESNFAGHIVQKYYLH
jgi:hypothetical protein